MKHVDHPLEKKDGTQVTLASNMFKCHLIKSNISFLSQLHSSIQSALLFLSTNLNQCEIKSEAQIEKKILKSLLIY